MHEKSKILLLGIGNCGRADDGLGWAFLDKIKDLLPNTYDLEYRYQLQIEDAELVTHYGTVVFIDAHSGTFKRGFTWEECIPQATDGFTSHQLAPEAILYLAVTIYNKRPKSFMLGISGENFCLDMGLSETAETNLRKSLHFFSEELKISHRAITG